MKRGEILAYAAGIMDGEGCIGIHRRKGSHVVLQVAIHHTSQWLVEWFKINFGGSVTFFVTKNPKHKDAWSWHLAPKQALEFLILIRPYLQLKRPHADLAIQFQSKRKKWGAAPKSQESTVLEEAQRILMGEYNRKGLQ